MGVIETLRLVAGVDARTTWTSDARTLLDAFAEGDPEVLEGSKAIRRKGLDARLIGTPSFDGPVGNIVGVGVHEIDVGHQRMSEAIPLDEVRRAAKLAGEKIRELGVEEEPRLFLTYGAG